MLKHFAFISDGDVFYVTRFDDSVSSLEKWIAVFSSDPTIVNVNSYPDVNKTYFYKEGNFYAPEDVGMENPLSTGESVPEGVARYAVVADNDVVGILTYVKEDMDPEEFDRSVAGLDSNPKIVPTDGNITVGYTWDGVFFNSPVGQRHE